MNNTPEDNKVKKSTVAIPRDPIGDKKRKHIKKEGRSIYEILSEEICKNTGLSEEEKASKLTELSKVREMKVNILLAGATGAGKSSTINALFDANVADVGEGVEPETQKLTRYDLNNLRIWDSPGFGDGVKDSDYAQMIEKKLREVDKNGKPLIDLVLVILDASSKDLGTSMKLINETIIPGLGESAKDRIIVALNQSDIAMRGCNHWIESENRPDEVLLLYLKEKAESVRRRIREATGVDTCPIFYAAGYTENGIRRDPYNLTKLLYHIVHSIPSKKRLALADHVSKDKKHWKYDDGEDDYKGNTIYDFFMDVKTYIVTGVDKGREVGRVVLGKPGELVGAIVGGVLGAVGGFFARLFG